MSKLEPKLKKISLEIHVSGLCFFALVDGGMYALLIDPSKMHHSSGGNSHPQHDPHLARAFIHDNHHAAGGVADGTGYWKFDLDSEISWPGFVVPQVRKSLPRMMDNLSVRAKSRFDKSKFKVGGIVTAIVPLNFEEVVGYVPDRQFKFEKSEGVECSGELYSLASKFVFLAEVPTTADFDFLKLGKLKPHNDKIEIRIKNTPVKYSHGDDLQIPYDYEDTKHFTALYDLLETQPADLCYPAPTPPPDVHHVGSMYTCMPGGGG